MKINIYILRQILTTLFFALIALCIIFIVVNFMEKMDNFMDSSVSIETIVRYYIVYLPEILRILTPVSILIACLFTIGRLSNNNEITAMKSGGMGLYRILFPIAFVGILLSIGQYYFNGWIVPAANQEKERISRVYLHRGGSDGPISNLAFRDSPSRNVLMVYYDPVQMKGFNIMVEEFDTTKSSNTDSNNIVPFDKINWRVEAKNMVWDTTRNNWILKDVIERKIINSDKITTNRYAEKEIQLNINQAQIEKINKKSNELSFPELKEYINLLKLGGKDVRKMEIDYFSSQALPLANFIVIIFAVTFASVKKRGGLAVQIAVAMVVSFAYLIFFEVMKPVGLAFNMSPILTGWFANILFFICGIITILKTRT